MTSDNKAISAIFGVFFLESAVLGNWIPRIPDFKANLALSDAALGLCLLTIPLGTIIGLLVAGRILKRTGLRLGCQLFLPAWALSFIFPAIAPNQGVFMIFLFFSGVAVGLIEVAMNTEADRLEQVVAKRIMSRCHGFWSLGSLVGAMMGGLLAHVGLTVEMHFIIVMPLLALAGFWMASRLPHTQAQSQIGEVELGTSAPESDNNIESAKLFSLPSRAIILLCIMPMGIMVVEGAFIDWSAVFVKTVLAATPLQISIIYSFFAVVMATVRLCGDAISDRYAAKLIVQVSGIASAVGISVFALSTDVVVAMIGAAISGMGVAIVYPLAITAAARRPGSAADNVAAITMISFSAFLLAPPIIGFISELMGLRIALLILAPVAATTAYLASEVDRTS